MRFGAVVHPAAPDLVFGAAAVFSVPMSLTVTEQDLIALSSEFKDTDPELIDTFIGWADDEIDADKVGQRQADRLALYLVAHCLTQLARAKSPGGAAAAGPLQSVTIGPVTKTFATTASGVTSPLTTAAMQTTSYGTEYLRLVRLFAPRMAVL